jgi:hypothetical protein
MGDGFVVVNGSLVYNNSAVTAYNISQLAAGTVTADTLEKGDTAYVLFSTDSNGLLNMAGAYISAKA